MLDTILLAINVTVLTYILIESLLIINQMSKYTPHGLRVVYIALSVGTLYSLTHPQVVHLPTVLVNLSLAYFVHRSKLKVSAKLQAFTKH